MVEDMTADVVHVERGMLEKYQRAFEKQAFEDAAIAEGVCIHLNGDQGVQVWFRTGEKKTLISAVGYTVEEALFKIFKKNRPLEISSGLQEEIIKRFQAVCKHDGKRHSTNHGYSYYCDICDKHLPSLYN